ncbi:MAG: Mur ligase family protein [Weeksellaceae bacterium]
MQLQDIKNIYHLFQAYWACLRYNFPSKKLKVIGITGTDGKTTTTSLIYHILKSAGKKVSMVSTVTAQIGSKSYDTGFHVTTPSAHDVQRYLHEALLDGNEYFVFETTSHGLDQYRVGGVQYEIGVITNITHEHLHYHRTYEKYVQAKARLIQMSKIGILNKDDDSYQHLQKYITPKNEIYTYGLEKPADYTVDIEKELGISLVPFNRYNYLAAYVVCKKLGLLDDEIFPAMKNYVLPPGRMDVVYDKEIKVIVDFAHTPNAIRHALQAVHAMYGKKLKRIIHIFGAAAFRDDEKRPIMGRESGAYADTVILTEEDYRTEDPYKISAEIAAGLEEKGFTFVAPEKYSGAAKTYTTIVSRQEAIEKAIGLAQNDDVIIMTGKGHEKSLCRGKVEYPWDDAKAALQAIKQA